MIDRLLPILVCPACHTSVTREGDGLVCSDCGRVFPIRDGIPVMLLDEATSPAQPDADENGATGEADRQEAP